MAAQSMIERVARAIYAAEGNQTREPGEEWRATRLDEEDAEHQQLYFDYARAAIEAMRKPSPKMLRAAGAALSPGKRPTEKRVSERAKHGIRYRAMIDAALEETK